jgi:uncharacterized protein GlcG (DUF336 family)
MRQMAGAPLVSAQTAMSKAHTAADGELLAQGSIPATASPQ